MITVVAPLQSTDFLLMSVPSLHAVLVSKVIRDNGFILGPSCKNILIVPGQAPNSFRLLVEGSAGFLLPDIPQFDLAGSVAQGY